MVRISKMVSKITQNTALSPIFRFLPMNKVPGEQNDAGGIECTCWCDARNDTGATQAIRRTRHVTRKPVLYTGGLVWKSRCIREKTLRRAELNCERELNCWYNKIIIAKSNVESKYKSRYPNATFQCTLGRLKRKSTMWLTRHKNIEA